jgi:hypothetical protein
MGKIILNINEEEANFFKKQYVNVVDIREQIERLFEEKPDGRKKKAVAEWKDKVNFLIDLHNARTDLKAYKKVK